MFDSIMSYTESEAKELLFDALKIVEKHSDLGEDWLKQNLPPLVEGWRPPDYLYKPDETLISRIDEYNQWCASRQEEDPGKLMEEIAFLAFRCLKGYSSVKSYQSYAPQLDLVISGSDVDWRTLMEYLHLGWSHRTILIEAKNLNEKVNVEQFSRLCSILENLK